MTFNPVLDGPVVPPPQEQVVVPLPPLAPAALLMLAGMGLAERLRHRRRLI
jgi:hypothetical protein